MLYYVNVTLGAVKTSILRPVGKQDDADALVTAGEIIGDLVQSLNLRREWKFLTDSSTYNVTTDGILTLNTTASPRIHKIYSVVGPWGPLDYAPKHKFDAFTLGGTQSVGGMCVYTAFTMGTANVLKIYDLPTVTTTFTVNYLKLITVPSADNVTFSDLPEPAITYIRSEGRARAIAEYGASDTQLAYWDKKAGQALEDLLRYDRNLFPDHIITAVASTDLPTFYPSHLAYPPYEL